MIKDIRFILYQNVNVQSDNISRTENNMITYEKLLTWSLYEVFTKLCLYIGVFKVLLNPTFRNKNSI